MEKKNEKLIPICIYCDSTGLFSEEEYTWGDNMTDMLFPEWIVREWYKENEKDFTEETAWELGIPESEVTFEKWLNEVYTCDDTDGLYDFAMNKGYEPLLDAEVYNDKNAVIYRNNNDDEIIVFKGTTFECRKWAKEHSWEWRYYYDSLITLQEEEATAELEMLF